MKGIDHGDCGCGIGTWADWPGAQRPGAVRAVGGFADGDLTYAACIANAGTVAGCTNAANPSFSAGGVARVAASPDGANVYAVAAGDPAVTTFNRAQTSQTITFTPPAATPLSTGTVAVSATPGVCTVAGTTVTLVTAGTCTINANQAGDATYAAAAQVQGSFAVTPAVIPADTPAATPGTTGQAQVPVGGCVTPPGSSPRTGLRRLLEARCLTNAGQQVRVSVSGSVPVTRWDVTYLRAVTKKHGRVLLRTYGYPPAHRAHQLECVRHRQLRRLHHDPHLPHLTRARLRCKVAAVSPTLPCT